MGDQAAELERIVSAFVAALRQKVRLERVLLFGSHARGEATADSDVDLLVISPDLGRDILKDWMVMRRCLPPRDVDVDTFAYPPEALIDPDPDSLLAAALREGKVVYAAGEGEEAGERGADPPTVLERHG